MDVDADVDVNANAEMLMPKFPNEPNFYNLSTCGVCIQKEKKNVFQSYGYIARGQNIPYHYATCWTSHVACVFQFIETGYVFSISIYFPQHHKYFWFANFLNDNVVLK